jgi:two-component system LytT family sensor kinase
MTELLNLVGLSAGIVLYAMLLVMVIRAARRAPAAGRVDPLLLATGVLGLVWNLCALPVYELPKAGITAHLPLLVAIGFSALGFLPSVVVHSVLREERQGVRGLSRKVIVAAAYVASATAAALHLGSAWVDRAVPSAVGMQLLTYTFVALIVPLALVTRGQSGSRRALWASALATFAVSAIHLNQLHRGDASWPVELLGHHASLPLAFAILYQDYPFALADLFLKRALALLTLIVVAFVAILGFGQESDAFAQFVAVDARQVGVLVSLWVATTLLYPSILRSIVWLVDTVILHRPDYRALRLAITRDAQAYDDAQLLLTEVCTRLAPALSARVVVWHEWPAGRADETNSIVLAGADAVEFTRPLAIPAMAAVVLVPTSEQPRFAITIAALTGGRRFLSDDLAALEAIALVVARRIDAIRITTERYDREIREQEIGKLASEAELRALRAQINPHFLFNALTTIGFLIQTAPPRALQTLLRLTSLLRAVLRSEGEFTTLGRELDVVESYLDIERARFDERLNVIIDVPHALRVLRVPPFILQPLVENAVKHGIAPLRAGGTVTVRATLEQTLGAHPQLSLIVEDTGAGTSSDLLDQGRLAGVGLRNVERRLTCQYGDGASLSVESRPGAGTIAEVRMPLEASADVEDPIPERVAR